MRAVETAHLSRLAALLQERTGLATRRDGYPALRLALVARLAELGPAVPDAAAYLELLRSPGGDEEMRRLLPLVTVGKTSFFRDARQFRALEELLPGMLCRARDTARPVSIWSAGCATGEEPYSIAMTAAAVGARPGELEILGTDVNPQAVAAAERGVFDARRVRDVPASLLERWFEPAAGGHRARDPLRRLVAAFQTHNLVAPEWPAPPPGGWSAVFCRNVIIYFDTPTTRGVLSRILESLAPGGWLFLGYSESLFRLFDGFELTEVAGAFLYRKPEARAQPAGRPPPVVHLRPDPAAPAAAPEGHPAPQEVQDRAAAEVARGRFEEARDLLEAQLALGEDLGLRLTLAHLHGAMGQAARAREAYQAAVAGEPLSAEAHLFFGAHLLDSGDVEEAARELSRALFLDPDLALAHYFLGRCREAQRDAFRARLCYRNAVEAWRRNPAGGRQAFLGHYPDLPADGGTWARAAESALAAL
jgi:chemotaxis protein methyltransferase CheR